MADYANGMPNQNDCENPTGYLNKAAEACAAGDLLLGMHLYLAAYELAAADNNVPATIEVTALREAWHLACDLKERSMAEYVFEKLEPYLTGAEIAECAMQLQELALDRLEQYGFSREDLEDMAQSISQDLLGDNAHVVKVESVSIPAIPNMNMFGVPNAIEATVVQDATPVAEAQAADISPEAAEPAGASQGPDPRPQKKAETGHIGMGVADVNDFNPYDEFRKASSVGKSYHACTVEGSGAYVFTRDEERATELERAQKAAAESQAADEATSEPATEPDSATEPAPAAAQPESSPAQVAQAAQVAQPEGPIVDEATTAALAKAASSITAASAPADDMPSMPDLPDQNFNTLTYRNLAGYKEAITVMRDMGIGMQNDPGFKSFVNMMNARHGLDRMPTIDTLLFRAPIIEDATRFAEATVGELGLPMLRMEMEEGVGGAPVLCLSTQGNNRPRMNHAHNRFEGPGVLVIDNLDTWAMPEVPESSEGIAGILMANISRGAREAVNLIRSAVEDPNVFVLVTASTMADPDPFFYELLEPITIIDIGLPNEKERASVWADIASQHPSIRDIDRADLLRFSEGLSRYDMYMAAREAVEDAYKLGLVQRSYVPVTPQNLFDKLAACQPLDSEQYRALEQAVVDEFKNDLEHLEDLLGGPED